MGLLVLQAVRRKPMRLLAYLETVHIKEERDMNTEKMQKLAEDLMEIQRYLEQQGLYRYGHSANMAARFLLRADVQEALAETRD